MGRLALTLSAFALAAASAAPAGASARAGGSKASKSAQVRVLISKKRPAIAIVDTAHIPWLSQDKKQLSHSARSSAALQTPASAPAPTLTAAQRHYLALAQQGVEQAKQRWGDRKLGWYDSRLGDHDRYPLATIWDIVPLFESLDAIATAQPTSANRAAVTRFGSRAERYLNRGLHPVPGYSPYPGDRAANTETWFDDNGWWGIALVIERFSTASRGMSIAS